MTLLSWTGVLGSTNSKLLLSSYRSRRHRVGRRQTVGSKVRSIRAIREGDSVIEKNKGFYVADRDGLLSESSKDDISVGFAHRDDRHKGLRMFYDHLLKRRTYLGCEDVLFEGGLTLSFTGTALARGLAEDFLLYLLNNHNILSCCFAAKGSSLSRQARRVCWTVQHSAGLAIAAFIDSLLLLHNVPLSGKPLVNMLVVRPAVLSLTSALAFLYTRTERHEWLGLAVTAVLLLTSLLMLVVAALLTPPDVNKLYLVLVYFLQVHLLSFATDIVSAVGLFITSRHIGLFIGPRAVVTIGQRLCEVIVASGLAEGVDYTAYSCGLLDTAAPIATAASSLLAGGVGGDRGVLGRQSSLTVVMTINPLLLRAGKGYKDATAAMAAAAAEQQNDAPASPALPPSTPPAEMHVALLSSALDPVHSTPPAEMEPTLTPPSEQLAMSMEIGGESEQALPATGLRRFRGQVRRSYRDVFHFFQMRDLGAVDAANIDDVDMAALRRAAEGGEADPDVERAL